MTPVEYIEAPNGPIQVGSHQGDPIMCFGAYKVERADGFVFFPHRGTPGTIGADPLDLRDPAVCLHLEEAAARAFP